MTTIRVSPDAGYDGFVTVLNRLEGFCVRLETEGQEPVEVQLIQAYEDEESGGGRIDGRLFDGHDWTITRTDIPIDDTTVVTYL